MLSDIGKTIGNQLLLIIDCLRRPTHLIEHVLYSSQEDRDTLGTSIQILTISVLLCITVESPIYKLVHLEWMSAGFLLMFLLTQLVAMLILSICILIGMRAHGLRITYPEVTLCYSVVLGPFLPILAIPTYPSHHKILSALGNRSSHETLYTVGVRIFNAAYLNPRTDELSVYNALMAPFVLGGSMLILFLLARQLHFRCTGAFWRICSGICLGLYGIGTPILFMQILLTYLVMYSSM